MKITLYADVEDVQRCRYCYRDPAAHDVAYVLRYGPCDALSDFICAKHMKELCTTLEDA